MDLPAFWRRASFAVAEAADLLGVPSMTLRTWLARCPYPDYLGAKTGGRIFLSGADLYFFALLRDLTMNGVAVRQAMAEAHKIASAALYGLPEAHRLVVRNARGDTTFELVDDPDFTTSSAVVIPLRSLAVGLIERAAVVYLEEVE